MSVQSPDLVRPKMVHEGGRRVWRVRAVVHPSLWIVEQWWLCASQAFFVEPSPNCVEAYRDAATIWWARLARGPDDGSVALLKFRIVILITVKRGPNLDQKIFAS